MTAAIRLVVLCGPTASGKSDAALALAARAGGEIVSCDSMAVYRGFDIGTAKPTIEERARVPHHLIDVADPDEAFTAARFAALADVAIEGCAARGVPVVVAGGTGLYLRALLHGLFEAPPPDPALRARLKAEAAAEGWPALHARLAVVDPAAAARIHPTDPVRIERALEIYEQTGIPLSAHHAAQARAPRYEARVHLLDPPPAVLDVRIAARVDRMLASGLVDETRRLAARWGRAARPLGGLGYKECLQFLDGQLDEAGLREAIRVATRHFGRRQRTWFQKEPGAARVPAADALPVEEMVAFLTGAGA